MCCISHDLWAPRPAPLVRLLVRWPVTRCDARGPVMAVQVTAGDAALAVVATAARLYIFLGGPGLNGAFSGYASRALGVPPPPHYPCPLAPESTCPAARSTPLLCGSANKSLCSVWTRRLRMSLAHVGASARVVSLSARRPLCWRCGAGNALSVRRAGRADMENYVELPVGPAGGGALALHCPLGSAVAEGFAWLAAPGALAGHLALHGSESSGAHFYHTQHPLQAVAQ